jgi:hypothetical protein
MSHHASEVNPDVMRIFREKLGMAEGLGATGKHPRGKLTADDEGEIMCDIAADAKNRKVLVNFGKPVVWIGFDPEQAVALAEMLLDKAHQARGIKP